MRHFAVLLLLLSLLPMTAAPSAHSSKSLDMPLGVLRDKIAGGWAGKMIGVTYGAPTEFRAQGKIFSDSIRWKPADVVGAKWQDDLYVQLSFLEAMDRYGIDAPAKYFQKSFAEAGYMLWHANVQARKNYYDGIFPPYSGMPKYNIHADDIDFQIESDYIGLMCPGMARTASAMAWKIGHIMNHGDGVYGGAFVAALYSGAYIYHDIPSIVNYALKVLPLNSDYHHIISDVIACHKRFPHDWQKAWSMIQHKWGNDHVCGAGSDFNIDAKFNGAFIVIGLLYGDGDIATTLNISTRCGQDSDCNPSNAMGILGVLKGLSRFPSDYRDAISHVADSLFVFTGYSLNRAVASTLAYARTLIAKNGGKVTGSLVSFVPQSPKSLPLEASFPHLKLSRRLSVVADSAAWKFSGCWRFDKDRNAFCSSFRGDEVRLDFTGTGISLEGLWIKNGGKADVYIDGVLRSTIDCFFFYANQEHYGINIFHLFSLRQGHHTLRLVVRGDKRTQSAGTTIGVSAAVVFDRA